jgi:hypothetical protein
VSVSHGLLAACTAIQHCITTLSHVKPGLIPALTAAPPTIAPSPANRAEASTSAAKSSTGSGSASKAWASCRIAISGVMSPLGSSA